MAQVYKITNTKTKMLYIGISIASDKTYLDRFNKHMSGSGGVWIMRDLESGNSHPNDFIIEVIEENDDIGYITDKEIYYIELYNTLWPNGYNGNKGHCIVNTPETIAKGVDTRKKLLAQHNYLKGSNVGHAIWRYPDGTIKRLPIDHPDVTSGVVVHQNYQEDCKSRLEQNLLDEQRSKNSGLTDKELLRRQLKSMLWKHVYKTDWWKRGRETMRNRMARKEFTDKELELYHVRRPEIVKQSWTSVSKDDRTIRTANGLQLMNSNYQCEHCGAVTNKGNHARWHGKNCKKNK